jgi:prepilin-type N-terminal cleavage/methylation domain-containing protein/prepilin-type processing-associated H-X9-DG protein
MVRKAFTLIELLVVIAILGCLMAVVIPCIRYSRYKAQSVICASNLGQLTALLNSYDSFQGTYPPGFCSILSCINVPPGGPIGNSSIDHMGWWWFHFLMETGESPSIVKKMITCPSSVITQNSDLNKLCGNYGINYSICKIAKLNCDEEFQGRSLSPASMRRPAQNILLADSGYGLMSWKSATLDTTCIFEWPTRQDVYYIPGLSINSSKTICPDLQADAVGGRHPNRSLNTIFADGSAKKMSAEDLLITTEISSESPAYLTWSPSSK